MYKKNQNAQITLENFNQPLGLKLNPENRWIKKADDIPWDMIEDKYASLFPSLTGTVAKPLRMALGSLIIQKEYTYADRELVAQIQENPYYQYFIGLPGYQDAPPYDPSLLVYFRKRLTDEVLADINDAIIENAIAKSKPKGKGPGRPSGKGSGGNPETPAVQEGKEPENKGTVILDATCAPQHIAYPQDINLLDEARKKLEGTIDRICSGNSLEKPRTYRREARKAYLSIARSRKKNAAKLRKGIKAQLQYIKRDLSYIDSYLEAGYAVDDKTTGQLAVIKELYGQQKHMYGTKTHTVEDRIVSISQPYIRPIVRGKAKAPVEFGAKLDISLEDGFARIETISFDPYNESTVLQDAVERFHKRNGCYPKKVIADKIYRNRNNLKYCADKGIKLSGPALGRPKQGSDPDAERKSAYRDSCDRIAVERAYSLAKRKCGLGRIYTRLESTSRCSIALSVLVMNLNKASLRQILYSVFKGIRCLFMAPAAQFI
jgi:IS5 family transposase